MTRTTMPALLPEPAQHTLMHLQCPACEALRRAIIRTGELGALTFSEMWPLWLEEKKQDLSPKTIKNYNDYYRALAPFFGNLRLEDIHIGNIVAYRAKRQVTTGPSAINHEVNALSQVLDRADFWAPIARHYKPLRLPRVGPGQALLEEEEIHLLKTAAKNSKWRIAYLGSLITAKTACGHGELRKLRMRDIDMPNRIISIVDGAKNDYRVRVVPLNREATWAMGQLYEMALAKGSVAPDHYLFPFRGPDPTKPQRSWKAAWYSLRKEAGKRYPKLLTLRMHDLRHHALTRLLENPQNSVQTIMAIAGHVSHKMVNHYAHIRMDAARRAVETLDAEPEPAKGIQLVPKERVH